MVLSKVFDCRCFFRLQFLFISSVLGANYLDSCFLLALTLSKKKVTQKAMRGCSLKYRLCERKPIGKFLCFCKIKLAVIRYSRNRFFFFFRSNNCPAHSVSSSHTLLKAAKHKSKKSKHKHARFPGMPSHRLLGHVVHATMTSQEEVQKFSSDF